MTTEYNMAAATVGKYLVGVIVKRSTVDSHAFRVRCLRLILDNHLKKHFNKASNYWAVDTTKKCGIGDVVLINQLQERPTVKITHQIEEQLFRNGATVDPITGKRCRGTQFIDMEARKKELAMLKK